MFRLPPLTYGGLTMKQLIRRVALALLALPGLAQAQAKYPVSRVQPVVETLHGTALTDNYRWLENDTAASTRAWIDAQNAFRKQLMGSLPARGPVSKRLEELLRVDVQ